VVGGRGGLLTARAALLAVLGAGGGGYALSHQVGAAAAPPVSSAAPPSSQPAAPSGAPGAPGASASPGATARPVAPAGPAPLPRSVPVSIRIPRMHLSASGLVRLHLDSSRVLEVPARPQDVGWFAGAPAPGSKGPAVIAGHVTWNGVPAVFYRLGALRPGDPVAVTRIDGRVAHFTVTGSRTYTKDRFPTGDVYGNLDHAGLRLITCGGTYDAAHHNYLANLVVFADLTKVTRH